MFNTGDLLPQASGSASIGVNQTNGSPTSTILPYNHVHMISGVWHDQSGQSGVLRYNRAAGGFEVSIDGGATFSLVASTTSIDLDDAYEVGNEINQNRRTLSPTALSEGGMVIGQVPVLIKHVIPGAGNTNGARSLVQGREDAGVIASGFSLTPNLPNTFAYGALGPGFLHLQASGTPSASPVSFVIGLGNVGSIVDNLGIFSTDAVMQWNIRGLTISTDAGEADGNIAINTGNVSNGLGGQVTLSPFAGSGQLNYNFGPYQSWYIKTSDSNGGPFGNGEWPIAHSGQVAAMISASITGNAGNLNAAYTNGNEINMRRDNNDRNVGVVVKETNGVAAFDLQQAASLAHLNYGIAVSGGTGANGFAFTKLIPNGLYVKSSGTASTSQSAMAIGYISSLPQTAFLAAQHDLSFTVLRNLGYTAGTANQPGGQINLSAFIGSGQIEYRYGPFQSWAMKVRNVGTGGPAGDGFHPIPHSGQINLMVLRAPKAKAITIERPAVNNDLTIWYTNEPITITEVESVLRGGFDASGQFSIRYDSDRSAVGTELTTLPITCTNRSTGQITTSFAAPNIPADNWIWIGVSGVSGVATTQMNVTIQYQ